MARITVEDCLDHVDNRFELVIVSSKRARQLATQGKEPMVPEENDKPTVLALREIEEGFIDASILTEQEESFEEDILATSEEFNAEAALAETVSSPGLIAPGFMPPAKPEL